MKTRIKYDKIGNELYSKERYKLRGSEYSIGIDLDLMTFCIVKQDGNSGVSVSEGKAGSVNQLKIKAKKALTELGVRFKIERRTSKEVEETLKQMDDSQ